MSSEVEYFRLATEFKILEEKYLSLYELPSKDYAKKPSLTTLQESAAKMLTAIPKKLLTIHKNSVHLSTVLSSVESCRLQTEVHNQKVLRLMDQQIGINKKIDDLKEEFLFLRRQNENMRQELVDREARKRGIPTEASQKELVDLQIESKIKERNRLKERCDKMQRDIGQLSARLFTMAKDPNKKGRNSEYSKAEKLTQEETFSTNFERKKSKQHSNSDKKVKFIEEHNSFNDTINSKEEKQRTIEDLLSQKIYEAEKEKAQTKEYLKRLRSSNAVLENIVEHCQPVDRLRSALIASNRRLTSRMQHLSIPDWSDVNHHSVEQDMSSSPLAEGLAKIQEVVSRDEVDSEGFASGMYPARHLTCEDDGDAEQHGGEEEEKDNLGINASLLPQPHPNKKLVPLITIEDSNEY